MIRPDQTQHVRPIRRPERWLWAHNLDKVSPPVAGIQRLDSIGFGLDAGFEVFREHLDPGFEGGHDKTKNEGGADEAHDQAGCSGCKRMPAGPPHSECGSRSGIAGGVFRAQLALEMGMNQGMGAGLFPEMLPVFCRMLEPVLKLQAFLLGQRSVEMSLDESVKMLVVHGTDGVILLWMHSRSILRERLKATLTAPALQPRRAAISRGLCSSP